MLSEQAWNLLDFYSRIIPYSRIFPYSKIPAAEALEGSTFLHTTNPMEVIIGALAPRKCWSQIYPKAEQVFRVFYDFLVMSQTLQAPHLKPSFLTFPSFPTIFGRLGDAPGKVICSVGTEKILFSPKNCPKKNSQTPQDGRESLKISKSHRSLEYSFSWRKGKKKIPFFFWGYKSWIHLPDSSITKLRHLWVPGAPQNPLQLFRAGIIKFPSQPLPRQISDTRPRQQNLPNSLFHTKNPFPAQTFIPRDNSALTAPSNLTWFWTFFSHFSPFFFQWTFHLNFLCFYSQSFGGWEQVSQSVQISKFC